MNYTVIVDKSERRRQLENRINAAVRRCKIGKVIYKTAAVGFPPFKYDHPSTWVPTSPTTRPWYEQQVPWCGPTAGGYVHTSRATDVPLS